MDRTKTKLATFFNNDDDDESFPQKPVDDQKLSQYAQGTVRKSKREKEKEREDAKKREEEELAAKTYAEFLDAFEGSGTQKRGTAFVRASASAASDATAYNPKGRGAKNVAERPFDEDSPARPRSPPTVSAAKPKGKRAMDFFLEEIKREQAEREQRLSRIQGRSVTALAAYEGQSGSKDRGDPLTSNVFVANLPANVNEMSLGNFFASRCGPVGSVSRGYIAVKIMWPRGDASQGPGADMNVSRSKRSAGLSGFVSFMSRKDAEIAVRDIDGFDWGGSVLRVGWSKAVPVAAKAAYLIITRVLGHIHTKKRFREMICIKLGIIRVNEVAIARVRVHENIDGLIATPAVGHIAEVVCGGGTQGRDHVHALAPMIVHGNTGVAVAEVIHLADIVQVVLVITPENRLYRSIIAGEALVEGFDDEGYNSVYSTDSAEESERERSRKHKLGRLARRRFEAMLRAMSGKRGELARCMAFSLEHAEAASEVSDIIVASLLVDSTPVPRKVARLHLICDILHNSAAAVPSAWKFRQEFQSRLGIVFDHLSSIYHSFPGRITAETFKKQIIAVVDIWEDWIVFPPEYIATLKSRLEGITVSDQKPSEAEDQITKSPDEMPAFTSKFKASSFKPAEVVKEDSPVVRDPAEDDGEADMDMDESDSEGKAAAADDVDGEPIDDVDGEPMDGEPIDGVPIDDIDGEPIDDNDIDGVAI
ncbi:hypothetical protein EW145_g7313 [Phellinidium pouzarii]|uniref:CID domain-containing protein n=1 Tax=Phellinidium pouzarii TaxID=167371 RepID=A0A4S4KM50_9AGAM|nr:hypothetical protein EW145_g7313 [Phellinidium pouzarii]